MTDTNTWHFSTLNDETSWSSGTSMAKFKLGQEVWRLEEEDGTSLTLKSDKIYRISFGLNTLWIYYGRRGEEFWEEELFESREEALGALKKQMNERKKEMIQEIEEHIEKQEQVE